MTNTAQTPAPPFLLPLLLAGLWNLSIGGLGVFGNDWLASRFIIQVNEGSSIFLEPLFWSAVMAFGVGYALVGFRNDRLRFFISIGAALKVVVFLFIGALWISGTATLLAFMAGTGDLLWAIYFIWFLRRTHQYGYW